MIKIKIIIIIIILYYVILYWINNNGTWSQVIHAYDLRQLNITRTKLRIMRVDDYSFS